MRCGVHEENLSALLDGELDPIEERRIRSHVAVCPSCRAALDEMRRLSGALGALGGELSASPEFVRRVAGSLRRVVPARPRPRARLLRVPVRIAVPAAAAAALLLVLGLSVAVLAGALAPPAAPSAAAPPVAGAPLDAGPLLRALAALSDRGPGSPPVLPAASDLGPDLPEPARAAAAAPRGREELLAELGLSRTGDRWLSEEGYRRLRAHCEEEEILARAAELRSARSVTVAGEPARSAANHPVADWFGKLRPGSYTQAGSVTVVAVLDGEADPTLRVLPAREAFESGALAVSEDRTTTRLTAENRDRTRHVFLPAGTVLVGGHQDRIVTRPTLIPPRTRVGLSVLCCEQGRSHGPSSAFAGSPGVAPPSVRRLLTGVADQEAVWARIAELLGGTEIAGSSGSLRHLFEDRRRAGAAERAAAEFMPLLSDPRSVGFLVYAGGRLLGGEVFGSHAMLRGMGPEILSAYLLDAAAGGATVEQAYPRDPLAGVVAATFFPTPGAAAGLEMELSAPGLTGSALIPAADSQPLHVSFYPCGDRQPVPRQDGDSEESNRDSRPGGEPPPDSAPGTAPGVERRMDERRENGTRPGTIEAPPRKPEIPRRPTPDPNGPRTPTPPGADRERDLPNR